MNLSRLAIIYTIIAPTNELLGKLNHLSWKIWSKISKECGLAGSASCINWKVQKLQTGTEITLLSNIPNKAARASYSLKRKENFFYMADMKDDIENKEID